MINVYIDTTGSMTEIGKNSAAIYVAKSIQDYCNFKSLENHFYRLDGTTIEILQSMKFFNDLRLNMSDAGENSILISDGLFESKVEKKFDIAISIGIDADLFNLKYISKKLFDNDSVLSALEYLVFHNNLLENTSEKLGEDDEW